MSLGLLLTVFNVPDHTEHAIWLEDPVNFFKSRTIREPRYGRVRSRKIYNGSINGNHQWNA